MARKTSVAACPPPSGWKPAIANDNGSGAVANRQQPSTAPTLPLNGSHGLSFNRRSTVSLAGGCGEVRLGRDFTPQFWNLTVFDPFGTNGVGATDAWWPRSFERLDRLTRASNCHLGYFLPGNLGGFYGQVQYYLGENASNSLAGDQTTTADGSGLAGASATPTVRSTLPLLIRSSRQKIGPWA